MTTRRDGSVREGERLARAALSRIGEPGDPRLTDMVQRVGALEVWARLQAQASDDQLGADLAGRIRAVNPSEALADAEHRGLRFVVPGDDEWPRSLDDLSRTPHLHERGGVPLGLWCRGPLRLDTAAEQAVAVVGSRSATSYGGEVAADIAAGLGGETWTVVSGAAFGIDQAAHRGALAARGATIAVLACGADRHYPEAHRGLIDYIGDVGLVVSEAAPGCAPTRIRFLARNRLIAALGRGAVVVEAAIRSGALNTASWAEGLGRPVMGVPGPVTSAPSAGVHQLIRHRHAVLVTSAEEVLEVVAPMGQYTLDQPREVSGRRDRLEPRQRQVLDAVPVRQSADAHSIARTAGMAIGHTKEALLALHRAGLVEHSLGRWRLVSDEGQP